MESGAIVADQITASSEYDFPNGPYLARLNYQESNSWLGAWSAAGRNQYQWLQVDFGGSPTVTHVGTQGRNSEVVIQWVSSYKLEYSDDGEEFDVYKTNLTDLGEG